MARRKSKSKSKSKRKWIQRAVKKEGALREYMMNRYGKRAFTEKGTIKTEYLKKVLKDKKADIKTKRRVRLALTLRRLRK